MRPRRRIPLERGEQVLGVARRRFLFEVPRMLFAALWVLLPFFFFFPLIALGLVGAIFFLILLGSGLFYAVRRIRMWRDTHLLITTHRLVDVDQVGFFKRDVTELSYTDVDTVEAIVPGLWARLGKSGTVVVRTTGTHPFHLELLGVHRPVDVRQLILDVQCLQKTPQA